MIDIKTLHIGSHVEYKGKIVRICSSKTNMANYDEGKGKPRCYSCMKAYYKDLQPIPITPDILKEFGFKQDMRFAYGKAFKMERGEMWIGVSAMSKGFWRIEAMDDTYNYGNCIIRYLHEAEAFLALYKIELIKE